MEASAAPTANKAWLLFAVSTVGMLIFAGLYFLNPKTSVIVQAGKTITNTITNTVTNTVTSTVTNEVVREVPKEVEKLVQVPADIPEEYILGRRLYRDMTNATYIVRNQLLFKMTNVQFHCRLGDDVKKVVTEDEVRAKFELTLRRNNVPINPDSENTVSMSISGFFPTSMPNVLCWGFQSYLLERQFIFRSGECHLSMVTAWSDEPSFGVVGREKANQGLLNEVEKRAEIFANDFLSANPKLK